MKYPLKRYQWLLREMTCSILGHDWKTSWRRKANYDYLVAANYNDISYRERKSGNAYFEYSAGWAHKCRRCRETTHDTFRGLSFIRQQIWNGIKDAFRTFKFVLGDKENRKEYTWFGRYLIVAEMAIIQFIIYQDWLYPSIQSAIIDSGYAISEWVYNNCRRKNEVTQ